MNNLIISPACSEDLDKIVALLEEARAWLHVRGIQQWVLPYPSQWIAEEIKRGEVYLARVANEPVGSITIQWFDEDIWPGASEDAAYIHRLIVAGRFRGQGLGLQLLRHAEQVARAAGKRCLRLDCWAGNQALCEYYEQAGFEKRDVVDIREGNRCYQVQRFERRIIASYSTPPLTTGKTDGVP